MFVEVKKVCGNRLNVWGTTINICRTPTNVRAQKKYLRDKNKCSHTENNFEGTKIYYL